jgi:hypothetical protein
MTTMTSTLSAFIKLEEEQGYSRKNITVVSGQNLAIGTVLGKITASGKYAAYDNDAADGTQTAAGILTAAVNASAADAAGVAIVRHAIAAKEQLIFGAAVTTQGEKDAAYLELEAIGILCRATV